MDISESIERAISSYFSQWLAQHPYLAWSIAHPIPSLCLLLLGIFTLWGLIKAIGRGIEQIWLFLLKTPFKLLQPIFRLIWVAMRRIFGYTNPVNTKPTHSPTAERIDRIVDRLYLLNQEQDLLLQELSTLTNLTSRKPEEPLTSDTQYRDL